MTIRRAPQRADCPRRCDVTPIRSLTAVAPSGAAIWLTKFTEHDRELSFGCGNITDIEYNLYRRARGQAERSGVARWDAARALLIAAGWTIREH